MALFKKKIYSAPKIIFYFKCINIIFANCSLEYILQDYLIKVILGEIELLLTNISNAEKPDF